MTDRTQVTGKNQEFTGLVESLGCNGEGIVHMGDTVFFAPFTVAGEKVKFRALKVKNRIGYAKALEILTPADERVRPRCPLFTRCGGCQIQHIRYGAQLKLKSKTVQDALRKVAGIEWEVPLAIKSDNQFEYRNKLQIPVGVNKDGRGVIGFYAERSHRIVPVSRCPIHPRWAEDVIAIFAGYMTSCGVRAYDERTGEGVLRHIVVRDVDGSFLVTAVTATETLPQADRLVALLGKKFKTFSLWQNVNAGTGNGVYGDTFRLLHGKGRYASHEFGIHFEVGPNTFVQVNRGVCRKLYERTVRLALDSGAKVVIDAYSGCGLLTAMFARQVGKAYGIEVVKEASACADSLIEPNRLEGKLFNICGKVEDELPGLLQKIPPQEAFLVVDPPRKGVDRGTLRAILASGIKRNPAYTQGGIPGYYELRSVLPLDMFPQTKHVETVVLLSKLNTKQHIEVELNLDELDLTAAESKATYDEIKAYVLEKYDLKVSSLYISQVKRKCGLEVGQNYNLSKKEDAKVPQCPPEKEAAIMEALKHFQMIM